MADLRDAIELVKLGTEFLEILAGDPRLEQIRQESLMLARRIVADESLSDDEALARGGALAFEALSAEDLAGAAASGAARDATPPPSSGT